MRCKELIATFTMEAGLVIAAVLAVAGVVQWKRQSGRQQKEKYILDYAGQVSELESQRREEERQLKQEEEKKQRDRVFGMDFLITHGSAFGGCAAVCADGTIRKDKLHLIIFLCMVSIRQVKNLLIISKIRGWKSVHQISRKN